MMSTNIESMSDKKLYIVSFISFADNEIEMSKVYATSIEDAMRQKLLSNFTDELTDDIKQEMIDELSQKSAEDLKEYCFNSDCMCNAILVE